MSKVIGFPILKSEDELVLEMLEEVEKDKNKMYRMQYLVANRWYEIVASDLCLHDLCKGPHARHAGRGGNPPARANAELKGVRVRFPDGPPPSLSAKEKVAEMYA